jgi:hypothetical protein
MLPAIKPAVSSGRVAAFASLRLRAAPEPVPRLPLRVGRENVIFCRHRRMARVVTKEVIELAVVFAAARWNAIGTKRTYPRRLLFVRFRVEADMREVAVLKMSSGPPLSKCGHPARTPPIEFLSSG